MAFEKEKAHCLVVSYPAQGHVNPMLQFCKRLESHKVKVTFVTTRSFWKQATITEPNYISDSIALETISDGYDEGASHDLKTTTTYSQSFRKVGPLTLSDLLHMLFNNNLPVDCVVYDSFLPWVLDVAKKFGLFAAAFFTQPCFVNSIYFHVHQGILKLPIDNKESSKILLPGLPELEPSDLPSFLYLQYGMYSMFWWDLLVDPLNNIGKADWILSNTVYELEAEVVDWMKKIWPVKTIGPTVPSMFLDKRIQDDQDYGISMFKPNNDLCMNWLHHKPKSSVIYVSFGSLGTLNEDQIEEIALGLTQTQNYFLWAIREDEQPKLPKNIQETVSDKGLIVTWCPQLKVLSHEAVGCFVTHCGWNSTLEALSLGVPMIGIPNWSDQTTNLKYIADIWKVGVRTLLDEKGIVRREMLRDCIKEVMEGEKGKEMKNNAIKWMNLVKGSMDEGGSSEKNITEFITTISDGDNIAARLSREDAKEEAS